MKIHIESKKGCITDQGRFAHGQVVEVTDPLAKFLIERGDAKPFETKEVIEEEKPRKKNGK